VRKPRSIRVVIGINNREKLERVTRFELVTSTLARSRSTN